MLSIVMPSANMLNLVILSVITQSVVKPTQKTLYLGAYISIF